MTYTFTPSHLFNHSRNRLGIFITWYGAWFVHSNTSDLVEVSPMGSILGNKTLTASLSSGTYTFTLDEESWGGVRLIWLD